MNINLHALQFKDLKETPEKYWNANFFSYLVHLSKSRCPSPIRRD